MWLNKGLHTRWGCPSCIQCGLVLSRAWDMETRRGGGIVNSIGEIPSDWRVLWMGSIAGVLTGLQGLWSSGNSPPTLEAGTRWGIQEEGLGKVFGSTEKVKEGLQAKSLTWVLVAGMTSGLVESLYLSSGLRHGDKEGVTRESVDFHKRVEEVHWQVAYLVFRHGLWLGRGCLAELGTGTL